MIPFHVLLRSVVNFKKRGKLAMRQSFVKSYKSPCDLEFYWLLKGTKGISSRWACRTAFACLHGLGVGKAELNSHIANLPTQSTFGGTRDPMVGRKEILIEEGTPILFGLRAFHPCHNSDTRALSLKYGCHGEKKLPVLDIVMFWDETKRNNENMTYVVLLRGMGCESNSLWLPWNSKTESELWTTTRWLGRIVYVCVVRNLRIACDKYNDDCSISGLHSQLSPMWLLRGKAFHTMHRPLYRWVQRALHFVIALGWFPNACVPLLAAGRGKFVENVRGVPSDTMSTLHG